jgi:orotidine-5'-phosphate decarboxylase
VGLFKVGSQLFTSEGPKIIEQIIDSGSKVFLDLKYHDIPNTVTNTARVAVRLGVSIFNIHSLGGYEMMAQTVSGAENEAAKLGTSKPLVLGVTILTSITSSVLSTELKIDSLLKDYVVHLSKLAQNAGLDGVVASPHEIALIRQSCGPDFVILTPGIRPAWSSNVHDQKRILTPRDAIRQGADYIVIGRPVIKAPDPAAATQMLLEELME